MTNAATKNTYEDVYTSSRENAYDTVKRTLTGESLENAIVVKVVQGADFAAEEGRVNRDGYRRFLVRHFGASSWGELKAHIDTFQESR